MMGELVGSPLRVQGAGGGPGSRAATRAPGPALWGLQKAWDGNPSGCPPPMFGMSVVIYALWRQHVLPRCLQNIMWEFRLKTSLPSSHRKRFEAPAASPQLHNQALS